MATTTAASAQKPESTEPRSAGKRSPVMRFLGVLGPGLISGASDDDPSGVATYAQIGAKFTNGMLWTVPLSLPLMMAVQEICDRTAIVTGNSLGALVRLKFGSRARSLIGVLLFALLAANTLNLAADLMAIGEGMQLVHAGPAPLWAAIAGIAIMAALFFGSFDTIAKIFKWLCLALLAYLVVLVVVHVHWDDVLKGLTGQQFRFTPSYLSLVVAVLGTTISPYMFFWQSSNRIEEMRAEKLDGAKAPPLKDRTPTEAKRILRDSRTDVFTGMVFSVVVMFAIIAATGATLGGHGRSIQSAADAAKALEPVAGSASTFLFAAGFIGSGILAVPILAASASMGIAGLLGKDWGLDRSPRKAPAFYGLIAIGMVGGILLSVFASNPFALLVLSATVNGIAAGPFLIVVMLISRDRTLMGRHRNGRLASTLGWATTGIMSVAGIVGLVFTVTGC